MKLQCWICTLVAMLFASLVFFAPSAMAETNTATFVREVTLSPGNWLWNHYARMSPEYRSAHPYKQFLESDACYLKDRKCTESDWKRVPKTQKVYIPTLPILVHIPANGPIPTVTLEATGNPGFFAPVIDEQGASGGDARILAAELAIQKIANTELSSKYVLQGSFFKKAISSLILLSAALILLVVFFGFRLLTPQQKRQDTESLPRGHTEPDHPERHKQKCC